MQLLNAKIGPALTVQWTAFGASASTALYVFLYSVHYFVFKTRMNGFFQTSFYFGCAYCQLLHPVSFSNNEVHGKQIAFVAAISSQVLLCLRVDLHSSMMPLFVL